MKEKVIGFIKKDTVLCVATTLPMVSAFFVKPITFSFIIKFSNAVLYWLESFSTHFIRFHCNNKEMYTIQEAVKKVDSSAFLVTMESNEVRGKGFKPI